jgi:hypothetical protein
MPINIPSNLSTSQYEQLVLQALSQIAGPGANLTSIPSILSTSDFRHLVLYALNYIATNGGVGFGAGIGYYGQVSRITSGTISVGTAGTYQSTGLTATLDGENNGVSLGTTDLFAVKNTSGDARLFEIYASADIQAANNVVLGIKLALNGVPIDNTECNAPTGTGSGNFAKLITNWMIELQPNDEVALFVTNKTSSGNMTLLRGRIVAETVISQDTGIAVTVNNPQPNDIIARNQANNLWINKALVAADISNSTSAGRDLLTAASVPAQRQALDIFIGVMDFVDLPTPGLSISQGGPVYITNSNGRMYQWSGASYVEISPFPPVELIAACSDEISPLTTGNSKVTFRTPCAFELTEVKASVNTAPVGSPLVVDINRNGISVLSTKLSIDAGETTSVTAAIPPVLIATTFASDDIISVDIDQAVANQAGTGLKVTVIGTRL